MSRRVAVLLAVAIASSAGAYDSQCTRPNGTACESGPDAGHNRWLGPSAEHEIIWEHTRILAGLPATVSGTLTFDVFTSTDTVPTGAGLLPTLVPAPFIAARRVRQRQISIGELAQLPDFSYALWDWALGNETCPLADGSDPITCHDFRTHMGPVNSNHFLPQAQAFYEHYHSLALGRAEACRELATRIGGQRARFQPMLEACEDEALVLEAVGHHYLQDAWSTGHMWERWGSPDPAAFPDPIVAIAVALASGLIHGARGVLEEYVSNPLVPFRDVPDALCAPAPGVQWRIPGMPAPAPGLGDLYYPHLTDPAEPFGLQATRLFSCAAAGMREVYAAAGQQHGPMAPLDPSLLPLDPLSDDCFAQRATNLAMQTGAALDVIENDGTPYRIALDGDLVSLMVIAGAQGGVPSDVLQDRYRLDMANALFRINVSAAVDPNGVEASGALPLLLGVQRNSAYVTDPPAPYADPALPWPGNDARTKALLRTFHRAHADDLCRTMGRAGGEPIELDALRARAQATLPPEDHATAVAACAELAARHLRFGKDGTDYDTSHEPLCAFVPGTAEFAYTGEEGDVGPDDFAGTRAAAESWCVATTTTTTTSTTTTTLPVGPHVQVSLASTWATVGATAWTPDLANGVYHDDTGTSYVFPYAHTGHAAAAANAAPPFDGAGASDGTVSHSADVQFDADGNLVRASVAGSVSGTASYQTSQLHKDSYTSKANVGLASELLIRFQVIGAPVAYTIEASLGGDPGTGVSSTSSSFQLESASSTTSFLHREGQQTPPQEFVDTGVLPPGDYVFDAGLHAGVAFDSDTPGAGGTAGAFAVTLTLAPVGGE
jgi:hypothetical protein